MNYQCIENTSINSIDYIEHDLNGREVALISSGMGVYWNGETRVEWG